MKRLLIIGIIVTVICAILLAIFWGKIFHSNNPPGPKPGPGPGPGHAKNILYKCDNNKCKPTTVPSPGATSKNLCQATCAAPGTQKYICNEGDSTCKKATEQQIKNNPHKTFTSDCNLPGEKQASLCEKVDYFTCKDGKCTQQLNNKKMKIDIMLDPDKYLSLEDCKKDENTKCGETTVKVYTCDNFGKGTGKDMGACQESRTIQTNNKMRPHGKDENGNPVDTCDMTDRTNLLCDGSYFENQEECKANCPKHSLFIKPIPQYYKGTLDSGYCCGAGWFPKDSSGDSQTNNALAFGYNDMCAEYGNAAACLGAPNANCSWVKDKETCDNISGGAYLDIPVNAYAKRKGGQNWFKCDKEEKSKPCYQNKYAHASNGGVTCADWVLKNQKLGTPGVKPLIANNSNENNTYLSYNKEPNCSEHVLPCCTNQWDASNNTDLNDIAKNFILGPDLFKS